MGGGNASGSSGTGKNLARKPLKMAAELPAEKLVATPTGEAAQPVIPPTGEAPKETYQSLTDKFLKAQVERVNDKLKPKKPFTEKQMAKALHNVLDVLRNESADARAALGDMQAFFRPGNVHEKETRDYLLGLVNTFEDPQNFHMPKAMGLVQQHLENTYIAKKKNDEGKATPEIVNEAKATSEPVKPEEKAEALPPIVDKKSHDEVATKAEEVKQSLAPEPLIESLTSEPPPKKTDSQIQLNTKANIMLKELGGQLGSNPGGTYIGSDGVTRYVKLYKDKGKAYSEATANAIYGALGLDVPKSTVLFNAETGDAEYGNGIANEFIKDYKGTLNDLGLNKERAQKILQGFAADMLLGNWDAVGSGQATPFDNIVFDSKGNAIRVDSGGALLYRGLEGKKKESDLYKLDEWEKFTNGKNPQYQQVVNAAGYKSADEMKDMLLEQVKKMDEVYQKTDGFKKLVPEGPGVDKATRDKILKMLEVRMKLLKEKVGLGEKAVAGAGEQAQTVANKTAGLLGTKNELMAKQVGAKQGTNDGGVFQGADGKQRYVKIYKNPAQAYGEAVANAIYGAVGVLAPKSTLFDPDSEKAVYGRGVANDMVDIKGTVEKVGLNKDIAEQVLNGFAADVLLANWDTIGLTSDNIAVDKNGKVVRLDNGGSLLFRAMASSGKKPEGVLDKITEWDVFSNADHGKGPANPEYANIFKAAGYKGPSDIIGRIKDQVTNLEKVFKSTNGFADLVPNGEGVNQEDRNRILQMLGARMKLLKEKVGI